MTKKENYIVPEIEVIEVEIEKGFALSDGSTVEQISGRAEEESWE